MNKKELIDYCNAIKENKNQFINFIDVNRIIKKIEQLDEPQKPVVPAVVSVWYLINKDNLYKNIAYLCANWVKSTTDDTLFDWMSNTDNFIEILVNMHKFGYEVEEKKRYIIKLKGVPNGAKFLKYAKVTQEWYFGMKGHYSDREIRHTRKQLEDAGFGWVFDCEGIEIEEVEE